MITQTMNITDTNDVIKADLASIPDEQLVDFKDPNKKGCLLHTKLVGHILGISSVQASHIIDGNAELANVLVEVEKSLIRKSLLEPKLQLALLYNPDGSFKYKIASSDEYILTDEDFIHANDMSEVADAVIAITELNGRADQQVLSILDADLNIYRVELDDISPPSYKSIYDRMFGNYLTAIDIEFNYDVSNGVIKENGDEWPVSFELIINDNYVFVELLQDYSQDPTDLETAGCEMLVKKVTFSECFPGSGFFFLNCDRPTDMFYEKLVEFMTLIFPYSDIPSFEDCISYNNSLGPSAVVKNSIV
ncbi:hypothetical protein A3Q34_05030 [Colwellia sp. PAMC 20917]|uniref:hypothetical protein n=1 Tax=Colwellia sp. PAMC 20917 TaxID=1816218 RepID=UPI0008787DC1|nr:hypothetical protein [Colwellia sp. PAMC 20917]AOW76278.1 hypothetical protein A3Q34_05030 [Colwellia sp. PAMC 20917]